MPNVIWHLNLRNTKCCTFCAMITSAKDKCRRKTGFVNPSTKNRQVSTCRFFIQSEGLVWHQRAPRVVWNCDEVAHGIARSAYQSSCSFGLMPYITSWWFHTALRANSIPQQVADSIHAFGVIWSESSPQFPAKALQSPRFYAILNTERRWGYEKGSSSNLLRIRQWNDWFLCKSVEYGCWQCLFHTWCCSACCFNCYNQ